VELIQRRASVGSDPVAEVDDEILLQAVVAMERTEADGDDDSDELSDSELLSAVASAERSC